MNEEERSVHGYIRLPDDTAAHFIIIAIEAFVFHGNKEGIRLARTLVDDEGNPPPIDAMVSYLLCEEGRLLTA